MHERSIGMYNSLIDNCITWLIVVSYDGHDYYGLYEVYYIIINISLTAYL